jgi:hypothetical protein
MNRETIRQETIRRLAEVDPELARDEEEVERQIPFVHRSMIEDAEISAKHHKHIAEEAITPRYREMYTNTAERKIAEAEQLRALLRYVP